MWRSVHAIDKSGREAQLREYLNDAREAILWKCEGLSDAQARTPLTPTGTHVMGLLLHLAVTESQYFGQRRSFWAIRPASGVSTVACSGLFGRGCSRLDHHRRGAFQFSQRHALKLGYPDG
ncbi:DUF664 domain-containing protein [Arthrobacter sp. M2012083]|uniref:mycothiol transferase n=1 Tax=Arthrobacter sp. M2012083 TaxID=1197706 RepID=UPI001ED97CA2|nr:DUF664 domain-containing protein [Arthrobacter sp. M2012083]